MIGENIKQLRIKNNMTQKDLAKELFVTAQAVSRWERGDVEPSLSTVKEMAKLFHVSTDDILGVESVVTEEAGTQVKYIIREGKPVLGICETCNKPIYEPNDIVRRQVGGRSKHQQIVCAACEARRKASEREAACKLSRKRLTLSIVFGIIGAALALAGLAYWYPEAWLMVLLPILTFTLISCCVLQNNFIFDWMLDSFDLGFVRLPGLIFDLSLEGCLVFLGIKLALWLLQMFLSVFGFLVMVAINMPLSLFTYPFALRDAIVHPEKMI